MDTLNYLSMLRENYENALLQLELDDVTKSNLNGVIFGLNIAIRELGQDERAARERERVNRDQRASSDE